MERVAIEEAAARLDELAGRVEAGETVTLTRDGEPVLDLVRHETQPAEPQPRRGGIDYEAGRRWLDEHGIKDPVPYIAPDFDDPLPEDFLLRPLP